MTAVKTKPRARDRRPTEVPHHPKVLAVAAIVSTGALLFMAGWFWNVMTGDGLLITAEQQAEARAAAEEAQRESPSDSDRARQAEAAQPQPTDNPGRKGKRAVPRAPETNDPVTTEIELTDWSILSVNEILQIGGEVRNLTDRPLSGTVRAYVYIDKKLIATAKTEIQNLAVDEREKVNLVSDSEYKPGTPKIILVEFSPEN